MSAPTAPTLASIVAEGLRQAGELHPSASLTAIYSNEVMEQLKNEIWKAVRQPKVMQTFSYGMAIAGQPRYSCPEDYSSDMKIQLMYGTMVGTAQGGTQGTIILENGSTFALGDVLGKEILITAGTGILSAGQILDLSDSLGTQTLAVSPNFAITPDGTSEYMIIDQYYPVEFKHVADFYRKYQPAQLTRPTEAYPIGDEDFDEFFFNVSPDLAYGMKFFYYANIMRTDLASNLMQRLYLDWRNFWIQGIRAKHLMFNDDQRGPNEYALWQSELQKLVNAGSYGNDLREMAQTITDY